MIEHIYLSDVTERESPAPKQVSLDVVGDVIFVRIEETNESDVTRTATIIQRELTEEEAAEMRKTGRIPMPVRATIAVDLGDLVEAVSLLAASSERLKARRAVETEQEARRVAESELAMARLTGSEATRKFDEIFEKWEVAKIALEETQAALKEAETQLRGYKWKLAEELHRHGRGPDPGPEPKEEAEDAAEAPA